MGSIWASIRTSLVQKVTDIRKSQKRQSQTQEQNQQLQQGSIATSEDNHDLVSVATDNQTEVNRIQNKSKYGDNSEITHQYRMSSPVPDILST